MKIKKSELRTLVEEVMAEAPSLAKQDPKKMAKGGIVGPRKNQGEINKLFGGPGGWMDLTNKLDTNVDDLAKENAISSAAAKALKAQITKMENTFNKAYKAEVAKHKKGK